MIKTENVNIFLLQGFNLSNLPFFPDVGA